MPATMRAVYSSVVNRIGHDPETGDLVVEWAKGNRHSIYKNVSPEKANQIMNAASIGTALRTQVQGEHDHEYL